MVAEKQTDAANRTVARKNGWSAPNAVKDALERACGNKTKAAEILGVSRASLRHRLTELKAEQVSANGTGHMSVVSDLFRSPLYSLDILKPETWSEKRPCWYCGAGFAPTKPNYWEQHFCSDAHRQAFNKYGYLPFDKLMLGLHAEIRRQIQALILESVSEAVISKVQPHLVKMIRSGETEMREYVRKTVASMLVHPERIRKELDSTGIQSQGDAADSGSVKSAREQVGSQ